MTPDELRDERLAKIEGQLVEVERRLAALECVSGVKPEAVESFDEDGHDDLSRPARLA